MKYTVIVTAGAKDDLRQYYQRAAVYAPETAARWLSRFETALSTLSINPQRCPTAPENDRVAPEIREFHFGKGRNVFRALLTITGQQVRILHVRRATMDWASAEDLME